jgi:membrane-bound serine protease (ClpP class)
MGDQARCNMMQRCVLALMLAFSCTATAFGQDPFGDPPELNWVERLQTVLGNPTLVYVLLLVGISGVTFEITHPGGWAPGVAGLVCLIFAFFGMRVLPINYVGLALMVLGILLVLLEVKVHSAGILTGVGLILLLAGSAFLIDPSRSSERVSWLAVAPVTISAALIMLLLVRNVVRAQALRVQTGMDQMIGTLAQVKGDMNGEGFVYVAGELWRARCRQPLQDGETVRIESYDGLTLHVKPGQ